YDAVILEYGTNEGNETPFNADTYAATLTQALTHVRAVFPQASCLLVGPPDRGLFRLHAGEQPDLLSYARIHQQIAIVQAQVGARFACAAWNWQDVMGGPGGSYGWALHAPPLMGPDGTHLTAEGYRQTGKALAHSLGW
ncbi:MAG: hypothetical protein JF615_03470, partial [Asticcacaulis sp.]|nr:hypothetical protein [Asticcacaulis sp.]